MIDRLLTLAEAAERLACSPATVKRRVRSGELQAFRDGRIVRVREEDLRRYVVERLSACGGSVCGELAGTAPKGRLWE